MSADRRQVPRRHEEALLHYAEQALIGAAITASDLRTGALPSTNGATADSLRALDRAVAAFRFAETQQQIAARAREDLLVAEDER